MIVYFVVRQRGGLKKRNECISGILAIYNLTIMPGHCQDILDKK